jgi:hypothetical protein
VDESMKKVIATNRFFTAGTEVFYLNEFANYCAEKATVKHANFDGDDLLGYDIQTSSGSFSCALDDMYRTEAEANASRVHVLNILRGAVEIKTQSPKDFVAYLLGMVDANCYPTETMDAVRERANEYFDIPIEQ